MKVAITGISGYLGELVADVLAKDSRIESILGLDIVTPCFSHDKLAFTKADVLSADFASLLKGIDALIHLAFIVEPPRKTPIEKIDQINIEGSRRVFEGALKAGVGRIIYSSSVAAYGAHPDNPQVFDEDSPLKPNQNWYYSRAKGEVEILLDELESRHPDIKVIRLRPSIFLGPKIRNSIASALKSKILICTNPNFRIDFCWDEDVAQAIKLALYYPNSDIFNLCGDGPVSVQEIGQLFEKRVFNLNRKLAVALAKIAEKLGIISKVMVEWLEVGSADSILMSNRKAIDKLKWRPSCKASEALLKFNKDQCVENGSAP